MGDQAKIIAWIIERLIDADFKLITAIDQYMHNYSHALHESKGKAHIITEITIEAIEERGGEETIPI